VLSERRERLAGNVKLVFQPSEERPPGGALPMIEQGVLEDPKVDAAFGLHLNATYPTGTIVARPGVGQAAADTFRIEIAGQGGHAARPHLCVDTVLVAAQVVTALHTLVAREVSPIEPAVLTVGMLQAGTAPNVIPPTALLAGTVRTFDPELRQKMARRVEEVAAGIARAMGAESRCEYSLGYPSVVNDAAMTELVAELARELVGPERVTTGERTMPADDFAYVLERVPGCYFKLGVGDPAGGPRFGNHHPRFDLDEAALPLGVEMFVRVVERYLAEER
jgi:amidohydrolase